MDIKDGDILAAIKELDEASISTTRRLMWWEEEWWPAEKREALEKEDA